MKIAVLDANTLGSDLDLSLFNRYGLVTVFGNTLPEELENHARDKEVLILNKVILGEKELSALPSLKIICLTATGYNNIDTEAAHRHGVAVCNVAGYSTESVVQHTFSMLFYTLQHLSYYDNYVKEGSWSFSSTFTHIHKTWNEIAGKKWGIIGLGNIGRRVAEVASAFGAQVVYYSTSGVTRDEAWPSVSLDELLSECDIISIHAPLNQKTNNLLAMNELKKMKKSAILLNLGRGGIVNEQDLADALDNETIAYACTDVLTQEPVNADNPLMTLKKKENLFVTPHIAWASIEARNTVLKEICLNIDAFIRGEKRNRVDSL